MKKVSRSFLFALALALPATQLVPARAQAQETPPPPPPPAQTSSGGGAGLGIGAFGFLSGMSGAAVVYDLARFHVEGMFGFDNRDNGPAADSTDYNFGVRGWYHLHQGSNSDFSLGGGIGLAMNSAGNMSNTATLIEPGALARVFLTSNFALHGTAGVRMVFGDSVNGNQVGFGLAGQLVTGFGFTYFFR